MKTTKTTKMSLANVQGKMNRNEMKKIIAGGDCGDVCSNDDACGGGCPRCEGSSRTCVQRADATNQA